MNKRYCDNNREQLRKAIGILCMIALSLAVASCNADEEDSIKENPYSGGREPLTVKLLSETPDPETAGPVRRLPLKLLDWLNTLIKLKINSILSFIYPMSSVKLRLLLILP